MRATFYVIVCIGLYNILAILSSDLKVTELVLVTYLPILKRF